MIKYCKMYIEKYYEHFRFFRPECMDRRIREIMMRKSVCFTCPGIERCQLHPEYWLKGEELRAKENERLLKEFPDQGELTEFPEDIAGELGNIILKKELSEREPKLGI